MTTKKTLGYTIAIPPKFAGEVKEKLKAIKERNGQSIAFIVTQAIMRLK